ncbi:oxygenase MpaB family protein [Gordonia zhaorongruii]|uniref:oxygenase MpaB family protein n=1 Tax=Gordonia zhaorongruii TaxID=2597659 RepID=UPI00104F4E14|nr:oxygenase MpaB family protein [Gordonia zhaorongruii]
MTDTKSKDVTPHADYGFFAPDSVTRRVWGYPTTPLHGIVRAVTVEELDPNLIASVDATGANYDRLPTRYARTVQYFAAVAFADARTVLEMADVLVKIHSKAIGVEPVSGGHYDANDPESQLWILVTGWHSVLKAYETFGPGRLTDDEVRQYWADCAIAAEMQTCDPDSVPRSREEVRAYFDSWRPHLAASEAAQHMMVHLLNGANAVVVDGPLRLARRPANWFIRTGTTALLPRHMRRLAGIHQSPATDLLITYVTRAFFAAFGSLTIGQRWFLQHVAPKTLPIVEPHWNAVPPVNREVLTPAEARDRFGFARPAEAHLELREKQRERVFGRGEAPSENGLVESQRLLGSVGESSVVG